MRPVVFRRLVAAAACVCLLATIKIPFVMANTASKTFSAGVNPDDLNGVWRSRGYGWLLAVENSRAHFYDESTKLCIKDQDSAEDLEVMSEGVQISGNGQTIRLPLGDASYLYTFDRIDGLPEKCRTKPDSGPKSVLESFIDIFTRHYAFFSTRNIDWPAVVESSRNSVNANMTSEELLGVVQTLISYFDDDHVSLMLWKPLPNGWTLSLSNEVYLDAGRKPWEGSGIPPQVTLEVFPADDVTAGHLKAVRSVVELVQRNDVTSR